MLDADICEALGFAERRKPRHLVRPPAPADGDQQGSLRRGARHRQRR